MTNTETLRSVLILLRDLRWSGGLRDFDVPPARRSLLAEAVERGLAGWMPSVARTLSSGEPGYWYITAAGHRRLWTVVLSVEVSEDAEAMTEALVRRLASSGGTADARSDAPRLRVVCDEDEVGAVSAVVRAHGGAAVRLDLP